MMTVASICWCESKSLARSLSALLSLAADTTTTPTTTHLLPSAAGLESAENTPVIIFTLEPHLPL